MAALAASDADAGEAPSTPLSVEEAVHQAFTRNRELLQRRLEERRARAQQEASGWALAPELHVTTGLTSFQDAGDLAVRSGEIVPPTLPRSKDVAGSSLGLSWATPIGTRLSARVQLQRALGGPELENDAAVVVSIAQPLLKDAWLPGAAPMLEESSLAAALAREALRSELEQLVLEVQTAYWDVALAQADVRIKERSLERARRQRDDTAENIRRGILADAELYLVEENVVFFESEVERAREVLAATRRSLARLLWSEPDVVFRVSEELRELPDLGAAPNDLSSSLRAAAARSPSVTLGRLLVDLARARERAASVRALPRLDLVGTLALSGAGTSEDLAVERVLSSPTQAAHVGLVFSLPLWQPAVRASLEAERIETARTRLALEGTRLSLRHAVEGTTRQLASHLRLEGLARRRLELAEQKLNAQLDKYRNGLSTLADVVRFQRELDEASFSLRRAVRDVLVSRARLLALEGRLADSAGIAVASASESP